MNNKDSSLILGGVNWNKLKNKKILLTGATGFIGKWLLKSFLHANKQLNLNAKIYCLGRNFDSLFSFIDKYDKNIIFLDNIDLLNDNYFIDDIDYVVHSACPSDSKFAKDNPIELLDISLNGTKNLLNKCINSKIKSILYLSSGAALGIGNYGEIKKMTEVLCGFYYHKYNLPIKTARIFTTIGPEMNLSYNFAICQFIKNTLENKSINLTNKSIIRSYLYIIDCVVWLWNILLDGENNDMYNVGSDKPVELKEIANLISKNINIIKDDFTSNSGDYYVPDVTKCCNNLGLVNNYELKEIIDEILKYESTGKKNIRNLV